MSVSQHYKKNLVPFIVALAALFATGMMFCIYLLGPMLKGLFMEMLKSSLLDFIPESARKQYYDDGLIVYSHLVFQMSFVFGFIFEIPALYIYVNPLIVKRPRIMAAFRIIFFYIFWILAAMISPGQDFITLATIVAFFVVLSELLIQLSRIIITVYKHYKQPIAGA
jgi:sec-independent protein translocase protein TatC